jgi:hypothetical protein
MPVDTPLGFEKLYGLGVYCMLPPKFPAAENLPALSPSVLMIDKLKIII